MAKTVYLGFDISENRFFFNNRGLPYYMPIIDIEFDYHATSTPPSDTDISVAIKQYAQNYSNRKMTLLVPFEGELLESVQKYASKYLKKALIKRFVPK